MGRAKLWFLGALLALVTVGCSGAPNRVGGPGIDLTPAQSVTGYITQMEFGSLHFRVDDQRQLIFDISGGYPAEDYLRVRLDSHRHLRVDYKVEQSRLVPINVRDL
ncbi:MAG TPA: hypothetical protein VI541_03070 [Actinomycetota bacterium]|nr:hypothetical protein [Actinomycetota bacterium]